MIIGSGVCGTNAALTLRREGWDGPIDLIGDEPFYPYDRTALSKPGSSPSAVLRLITEPSAFEVRRISFHMGKKATSIDASKKMVHLDDGSCIEFEKLLIATGARPRKLNCEGYERAHTISNFEDAQWLTSMATPGKSVVLVGAGLLGLELAATLNGWGLKVAIVEAELRALANTVPPELADRLVSRHCSEGATFRFGRRVRSINPHSVELDDGSSIEADFVIAAIGHAPRTNIAKTCDLGGDHGIIVDQRFRTDDSCIFAAGDCAVVSGVAGMKSVRSEHWLTAKAQGEGAARSMLGKEIGNRGPLRILSHQYDLMLATVGSPLRGAETVARTTRDYTLLFNFDLDGTALGVSALGKTGSIDTIMGKASSLVGRRFGQGRFRLADTGADIGSLLRTSRKTPTSILA